MTNERQAHRGKKRETRGMFFLNCERDEAARASCKEWTDRHRGDRKKNGT